jgi:hypothetical protein
MGIRNIHWRIAEEDEQIIPGYFWQFDYPFAVGGQEGYYSHSFTMTNDDSQHKLRVSALQFLPSTAKYNTLSEIEFTGAVYDFELSPGQSWVTNIISEGTLDGKYIYFKYSIDDCEGDEVVFNAWGGHLVTLPLTATVRCPSDGEEATSTEPTLSWVPGREASSHDVFFSTDFNDVNEANNSLPPGGVYKGNQQLDANSYQPAALELGETYYWRIDQVNETNIWKGDVCSFTTGYAVVDEMETYADVDDLNGVWIAASNAVVDLCINTSPSGEKWMLMDFNNVDPPYYSQASSNINAHCKGEITAGRAEVLSLWYKGGSDLNTVYVKLEDASFEEAVVAHGDPNLDGLWHEWNMDLQDFVANNASFDLTNVASITVGVGDGLDPSPLTPAGQVYFDNIRLYPPRCLVSGQWKLGSLSDLNGDCVIDFRDFNILANNWLKTGMLP